MLQRVSNWIRQLNSYENDRRHYINQYTEMLSGYVDLIVADHGGHQSNVPSTFSIKMFKTYIRIEFEPNDPIDSDVRLLPWVIEYSTIRNNRIRQIIETIQRRVYMFGKQKPNSFRLANRYSIGNVLDKIKTDHVFDYLFDRSSFYNNQQWLQSCLK